MREFSKLGMGFWTSDTIQSLSDDGKLLALYLISGPHSNAAGVFRCPDGYVTDDLKWERERVSKGFTELFEKGFAARPGADFWVVITKHFKHNPPENPNQAKNVASLIERMPRNSAAAMYALDAINQHVSMFRGEPLERIRAHLLPVDPEPKKETLSKPFRNTETETKTEKETKTETRTLPPGQAPTDAQKPDTSATWNAYSKAFQTRYDTDPKRNATVNSAMLNFVKRIGAEESPSVAEFYVRSNDPQFVRDGHSVQTMVRLAESIRTRWASGSRAVVHRLSPAGQRTAESLQSWIDSEEKKDAAG